MANKFKDAPEIKDIADELIDEHSCIGHLASVRVDYRWREKAAAKNGKTVLGTAALQTGLNACEINGGLDSDEWVEGKDRAYFRIEIAHDTWQELTSHQRRALVFHELLHCGEDDDGDPIILPHDVEEFRAAVAEFGLWKSDLEQFATACVDADRNPRLPLDDDEVQPSRQTLKSMRDLCPGGESGLSSVTISTGDKSVTLTEETRKRIDARLQETAPLH